jgi:hypothetical protein
VFYQDFKFRKIHIAIPLIIFLTALYYSWHTYAVPGNLVLYNLGFLLVTIALLVLYMSVKNRKYLNPFENYFGLGDLLLFASLTPLFVISHYIIFFIVSMVFSLIIHLGIIRYLTIKSVPLAGYVAILFLGVIAHDLFADSKFTVITISL